LIRYSSFKSRCRSKLMRLLELTPIISIKFKSVRRLRGKTGSKARGSKLRTKKLEICFSKSLRKRWRLLEKLKGSRWRSICTKRELTKPLLTLKFRKVKLQSYKTN
jgi:hypothetical protein